MWSFCFQTYEQQTNSRMFVKKKRWEPFPRCFLRKHCISSNCLHIISFIIHSLFPVIWALQFPGRWRFLQGSVSRRSELVWIQASASGAAACVLCVQWGGRVVYGDHSGLAVVAGGAELLWVIPVRSGQLEAVLRCRVWVGDAARHGADPHAVQRNAAVNRGLGRRRTRFGARPAPQQPGFMSPSGQEDEKTYFSNQAANMSTF